MHALNERESNKNNLSTLNLFFRKREREREREKSGAGGGRGGVGGGEGGRLNKVEEANYVDIGIQYTFH